MSADNILTERISNFNGVNNSISTKNLEKLQVLYTNCDCFTKTKLSELQEYVNKHSPDIIAITEVFAKSCILPLSYEPYQIKDYNIQLTELKGRGVCIYTKSNLNATSLTTDSEFTRYRNDNIPSILDLVFSNEEHIVCNMNCLPGLGSSDHVLIRWLLLFYWCNKRVFYKV